MANRLLDAKSPYLQQHAHNPVDWYAWGEEAFNTARERDVPIFLSIGYATCHWCHVMERESFEDPETAALMNDAFVCVKVDREERPDVDALYMAVCLATHGRGGWPLTLFLTPDLKPFFSATYIPRESRGGHVGMRELIPRLRKAWNEQRQDVRHSAEEMARMIGDTLSRRPSGEKLGEETITRGYANLRARFDAEHGGFGGAPKFPTPHVLLFLLRFWRRTGNGLALAMVEKTLRAMRRGGLWDHVGGGFHRYSTDSEWRLPHFEKMLYDQAMLSMAYTEAARATGAPYYRFVADLTLEYVLRDLHAPEGAFYAAEDADSENPAGEQEEGAFYLWTESELLAVLGPVDASFARTLWATESDGNFEDETTRTKTGANVLYHPEPLVDLAERLGMGEGALRERTNELRARLMQARSHRNRPLLDGKILTDWNGLTIAGLSRAARAFGNEEYAAAARTAADFLLDTMLQPDGTLLHRYFEGDADIPGTLDDYAALCWGLTELYQAVYDERYLQAAIDLHHTAEARFGDEEGGGYFLSEAGRSDLFARQKEYHDGATPSGAALMTFNGFRLARITGDMELERRAARAGASAREIAEHPDQHAFFLIAADFATGAAQEVVVAGDLGAPDMRDMLDRLGRVYAPNLTVLARNPGRGEAPITAIAPITQAQEAADGRATAYVCERETCSPPTTDPAELLARLNLPG